MELIEKNGIYRVGVAILLIFLSLLFKVTNNIHFIIIIIAYLICGIDVIFGAIKGILEKEGLNEKALMTVATIGAFIIGETHEALAVIILYQIGEMFQDYSIDKSKDNMKLLLDLTPKFANLCVKNGIEKVEASKVKIGDIIIINPYEKIPLDGKVVEGDTSLNTSALTGESIPRYVSIGDFVASGLINNENVIKIKVTNEFENSTANKIIELIESASEKKSKSEKFITSFSKIYTPIVCIISLCTFLIPAIYYSFIVKTNFEFNVWVYRSLTVLVISCPCAILLSVPLAFFSSIGSASRHGILIKGSNYLEKLSKVKTFAFDKTGTMTKGVFEVVGVHHNVMDEEKLFRYVAHIEHFSNHPIAKSIQRYYNGSFNLKNVKDVKEIGGRGLSGIVEGKIVIVGNEKLMKENNIDYKECREVGTIVHVAIDGVYEGHILITDIIKKDAKNTLKKLKDLGIKNNILLTGDRKNIAEDVSSQLGIDECYSELLPNDKIELVEKFIKNGKLSFVGDGINDTACIVRSDVGIAMGAMGADSAIDFADIVLVNDDISNVATVYRISKKTMAVVCENVVIAIGIKLIVLVLSIIGISNMWLAVFSDVGVMILAVINSVRLLVIK